MSANSLATFDLDAALIPITDDQAAAFRAHAEARATDDDELAMFLAMGLGS